MENEIIKRVLTGAIQREDRSNLANQWVKLCLISTPLAVGIYLLIMRLMEFPFTDKVNNAFITILLGILIAQSIDLRKKNIGRLLRWTFSCIAIEIVVILTAAGVIHVEGIKRIPLFAPIGFVSGFITLNDLIIFMCFLVSARGVRLLNASDAYKFCSLFGWLPILKVLYETTIVTYFTITHSISGLFSNASMVAKNRYRLMKPQTRRREAFLSASIVYINAILVGFTERAELTESILEERQWYSGLASSPVAAWNPEDSLAVIVVIMFFGIAWLGFLIRV